MFLTHATNTSTLESIGQLICLILLFLFVLFLAYMAARISGSFQSNVLNKHSNIKVIEVFRISNNKVIEIVKVGEEYLVLAVCKDNISLLTKLDETQIKEPETSLEPINFKNILDKMRSEKQNHDQK